MTQQIRKHGAYDHMPSGADSLPWTGDPANGVLGIHMIGLTADMPAPSLGTQSGSDGAVAHSSTAFTAASGRFAAVNTGDTILIIDSATNTTVERTVTFVSSTALTLSSAWPATIGGTPTATSVLSWVLSGQGPSNAGMLYLATDGPADTAIRFNTDNIGGWLDITTNDVDGSGYGFHFADQSGGGILFESTTGISIRTDGTGPSALTIMNDGGDLYLQGADNESNLYFKQSDSSVELRAGVDMLIDSSGGALDIDFNGPVVIHNNGVEAFQTKYISGAAGVSFFGVTPVVQQGTPSSAQDIADALAAYGLLATAGTIGGSGIQFATANTGTYLDITTTADDGTSGILLHDTGSGPAAGILIYSDFGYASLAGATGLTLQGGSSTPGFMFLDDTGVEVDLRAGLTFTLKDSSGNPKIRWTEGTLDLHIPAGGTVVADL